MNNNNGNRKHRRGHRGGKNRKRVKSLPFGFQAKKYTIKCGMGDNVYVLYTTNSVLKLVYYFFKCIRIYNHIVIVRQSEDFGNWQNHRSFGYPKGSTTK